MRTEPEISGVTVILLGKFNPTIFTPAWFALHDLLPESAAESAELKIGHPQVTAFSYDWLRLEVTTERFIVETWLAPYIRLCDLVAPEHLYHTNAFGIKFISE